MIARLYHALVLIPALIPALALCACQSPFQQSSQEVEVIAERHRTEKLYFEAEQRRIGRSSKTQAIRDFGIRGQIYIRKVDLLGWWNASYLRVEYTFVNPAATTRQPPTITLIASDPASTKEVWLTEQLPLPLGLPLSPESTYSSWIEVPLEGLHRREGWTWDIVLEEQ